MRIHSHSSAAAILATLSSVPIVSAWGRVGHRTIALLSALYLTDEELSITRSIIAPADLSDASIWADEVSQLPALGYTKAWHYVNVDDFPPTDCSLHFGRDYNDTSSDILNAFANHTSIFGGVNATAADRRDAMKFLLHWVADVHQPLHVEGLAHGGNDIPVFFAGELTNLHAVWDVHIIEKYRGAGDENQIAQNWAEELFADDPNPELVVKRECHSVSAPLDCILAWAREANQAVCETVFREGLDRINGTELSTGYYQAGQPVVERQIKIAGQRLAAWIKALLAGLAENPLYWADQTGEIYSQTLTGDFLQYHEEI